VNALRLKRAALVLSAAALVMWINRRIERQGALPAPNPHTAESTKSRPDRGNPRWEVAEPDATWTNRLRDAFAGSPDRDNVIRGFIESGLPRGTKIQTLMELFPELDPARRMVALDVLATFQPIEASAMLADMLANTDDARLAVKILQTLRSATLISSSENPVDLADAELANAFELVQKTFRDELGRVDGDPDRFRAAVAAIPDVFPGDEALRIFESLRAAGDAARENGRTFPLTEAELFGQWLEFSIGAVDRRDFRKVSDFINDHPQALADEGTKARVLNQLRITPIRADEADAVAPLIERLEPAEAPDDSFVRWLETKALLTGSGEIDHAGLLHSASPMRKAALIHFGDLDLQQGLTRKTGETLKRELTAAAGNSAGPEEKDFLESAAAAIPGK
jgi:hypothetical protein